jgi:hypothetical protein
VLEDIISLFDPNLSFSLKSVLETITILRNVNTHLVFKDSQKLAPFHMVPGHVAKSRDSH